MRIQATSWSVGLMLLAGCSGFPMNSEESAPRQVSSNPFAEPRTALVQTRVSYAPASQDACERLELISRKLIGDNPQTGLRPKFLAVSSPGPEIFHVGMSQVYVTDTLLKQCQTDGQLAAALANEIGRMVSEREAAVSDEIRRPEPLPPMRLPIAGNGYASEADPTNMIELARYEKNNPKTPRKLPPVNPQLVARSMLTRAGYQAIELDAVMPILQNAQGCTTLESQFKAPTKQSDWKQP